ncbi:MAG: type VI secretion system baseplate subunit TssK [Thermoanaerobaculia bacterium]
MTTADTTQPIRTDRRKGRARTTARDVPPAIQWHEGMLLAPQHFQGLAQRQETLLHYHATAISPFHWGVRHLEVDTVKLVDGLFRVIELEAVMPDGLVVSYSAGDGPDLVFDLTQLADIKVKPATVHLAVVARSRGLALAERFAFEESGPVPDENTGEGELPLIVLRPRLHLIAGEEPAPKYVTFPLAEVKYEHDVYTRTRFEPPLLRVAPGSAVHGLCSAVTTRLREKAAVLADQARSTADAHAPQRLETKTLIHCLVGELPAFEAVLGTGNSHPFQLYVAFCSLLGHVAGVSRSLIPPPLERYDHNDLMATFDQVRAAISRALDEGIHEAYTAYTFRHDGEEFRLYFDPEWMTRPLVIGVRAPAGMPAREMTAWMSACVIGSRSHIESLRDRRMSGARRKAIEADADLVPSTGVTLYALTADPELITPGEDLVVLSPGESSTRSPDQMVLYIRKPPDRKPPDRKTP